MANPVFPELMRDAIAYATAFLYGMPNTIDVRIATKVLIIKHLCDKLTMTLEDIVHLVEIDVLPDPADRNKFKVRIKPTEE